MPWLGVGFFFLIYLLWERRRVNKALKETRTRLQHAEELLLEVCAVLEETEETPAQPEDSTSQREPFTTLQNLSIPAKVEIRKQSEGTTPAGTLPTTDAKAQDVGDGSFLLEKAKNAQEQTAKKPDHKGEEGTAEKKSQVDSGVRLRKSTKKPESLDKDKQKPAPSRKKSRSGSSANKSKSGPKQKTSGTNKESKEAGRKKPLKQTEATAPDREKKRSENKQPKRTTSIKKEVELSASSNRHQTIIDLYKKGAPVKEIARQVESGQGEVQLIIDLYSKK